MSLQPMVVVTCAAAAAGAADEKSPHHTTKGRGGYAKAEEREGKAATARPRPRYTTSTSTLDDESHQSSDNLPTDASTAVAVTVRRRASDNGLMAGRSRPVGSRGAPRRMPPSAAHGGQTPGITEVFRMRTFDPPAAAPTAQDKTGRRRQTIHTPDVAPSTPPPPTTRNERRRTIANPGVSWAKSVPDLRRSLDQGATDHHLPGGEDPARGQAGLSLRGTADSVMRISDSSGAQQMGTRLSRTSQRLLSSRNQRMPPPMLKQHASYI